MTPYAQMLAVQLRPEAQATYNYEYQRYAKDSTVALMLTLLLGIVGGEAYYFGDYKRGILMTLGLLSGVGLFITVPVWIVRCFTVQNECETYNDYLAYTLALRYWPNADSRVTPPEPPIQQQPSRRANISGPPMRVAGR